MFFICSSVYLQHHPPADWEKCCFAARFPWVVAKAGRWTVWFVQCFGGKSRFWFWTCCHLLVSCCKTLEIHFKSMLRGNYVPAKCATGTCGAERHIPCGSCSARPHKEKSTDEKCPPSPAAPPPLIFSLVSFFLMLLVRAFFPVALLYYRPRSYFSKILPASTPMKYPLI